MTRQHHPFALAMEAEAIATFRQGELTERERIRAILTDDAARGREGAAAHLALTTDLSARTAIQVLEYTPRADAPAHRVRPLRWPTVNFSIVGVIDAKS